MFKGRASIAAGDSRRSTVGFSAKSQKRQSTIPVRPGGGKFPGRNLARPVAGNLIAEGSDEKEMSNNNSKSTSCFGFLRPTLSSMAKTKPHVQHDSIKSNESEHKSPAKPTVDYHRVVLESTHGQPRKPEVKRAEEIPKDDMEEEKRKLKPCNHASPFTIYEASDDSFDTLCITPSESHKRPTISSTPKYPRTKSLEKNTKRRLQFRQQIRPHSHEKLRNTSSPPPDFDVTVNTALTLPSYVPPVSNYEKFSTPIVNLTSALSLSDEENETVYYTPCAEF